MKTRQEDKTDLEQLNIRVNRNVKTAVKSISAMTGHKLESIGYDAIRSYLGQTDPDIEKRRRECQNAFKAYAAMERDGNSTAVLYRHRSRLTVAA